MIPLAPRPRHGAAQGAPIPARAGIGLRFPHHEQILAERPKLAWLEVHPENYLGFGPAAEALETIRARYPLSLHATGLSLGSAQGLDADHLAAIADLARRLDPALVSDHLSWSAAAGVQLPDLLPLPYTEEALAVVARNLDQAQTALRRPILIENPSTYLRFAVSALSEAEFLAALVARTGCGVLLDVNNVYVSACNLGERPSRTLGDLLDAIPSEAIREVHLAGHAEKTLDDGTVLRIDDHGSEVSPEVWGLFAALTARIGPRPTLIEWDTDIPPLATLMGEAAMADAVIAAAEEPRHAHLG
jgi:uncharacterized protein (UPF0276 family)